MGTRTNLRPQRVIPSPEGDPIDSGDMGDDITSAPILMQSLTGMGFSFSWLGTSPVGTLAVEISNDFSLDAKGEVLNEGTWTTLTLNLNGAPVQSIPVTGNSGNAFIDIEKTSAYAIRAVYTATSGDGELIAYANGKVA